MARSIVVTSGKGGVGKSTVTVALGKALCRRGKRVVLVDTDIGLNNLDVLLDMEHRVVYDLLDVVHNRCRVRQALLEDTDTGGLFLLPSAHTYEASEISAQNIRVIVNSLAPSFDYVLIDCPAGIELGFHRSVAAAREALVVTTPHISAVRDASKVIPILTSYGLKSRLIVNRCRGDLVMDSEMADCDTICEALGVGIAGVIPDDDVINLQSNALPPRSRRSEGLAAIEILADNVMNGTDTVYDVTRRYRGLFGFFKRGLRKLV
ncbi:MAG: septum site-determining protein MinD [Clostridia bacterium]|nr:septum site-determining protein MinD [Clostridia bacterium]